MMAINKTDENPILLVFPNASLYRFDRGCLLDSGTFMHHLILAEQLKGVVRSFIKLHIVIVGTNCDISSKPYMLQILLPV